MRSATAAGDPWWARLVLGTGSRRALQRGDDSRGRLRGRSGVRAKDFSAGAGGPRIAVT
jgi:hypothetical protein